MGCEHAVEAFTPNQRPYIKHFSSMQTFYVTEIDNVIDIEVDLLLWLCYKCAMHLYSTIALYIIMAFDSLRHEQLAILQIVRLNLSNIMPKH